MATFMAFRIALVVVVVMVVCVLSSGVRAVEAVDPANAVWALSLQNALPKERGLNVNLRTRGGKFVAGVGHAPQHSRVAHAVDCSNLVLDGASVKGELRVVLTFDGYLPEGGKPLPCVYRLDAKLADGKVGGSFEGVYGVAEGVEKLREVKQAGAITGTASPSRGLEGWWVLDIHMENGAGTGTLGGDKSAWGHRVYPKLFYRDGKLVQSLIYGWGGRAQINYFESAIVAGDLKLDEDRFAGPVTVKPTGKGAQTGEADPFTFTFDGTRVGSLVGGTFAKRVGDKDHPGGPFRGELRPMAAQPPGEALYQIDLHHAVAGTKQLLVNIPCSKGRFAEGMAYSGAWNHTYHDVDGSKLKLDGESLKGELQVTMNPDPYIPPDRKPVPAAYALDARVIDGRIVQGTYTGTFGDTKVSGPVMGELLPMPVLPEPVAINLKLDDATNGGAPWHRRAYIGFVATGGKADQGGFSNNKHGWTGTFKRAEIRFDGLAFIATIEATIDTSGSSEKGPYTFKLSGRVIGQELVGKVETWRDGKMTKSGTAFMGSFGVPKK